MLLWTVMNDDARAVKAGLVEHAACHGDLLDVCFETDNVEL